MTVLQLALAYAALANGGTLYKPQLVRKIVDQEGKLVERVEPEVVAQCGAFLGEEAVLTGEAHCRADISLPGNQAEDEND